MNWLQLSWKNIINRPLSMVLSIVLFALGVGLISILLLLDHQLEKNFEKNLAGVDLVVGAKGSPLQLILCSMYHIDAPTGNISLKDARPFMVNNHPLIEKAIPLSMGDSYRGYRIVGTTKDLLSLYDAKIATGKVWKYNFETTIGAAVAKELNLKIGDQFQSSHGLTNDGMHTHDDVEAFKVVGILEPSGSVIDQLILTTTQSFWLIHEGHDHNHDDHDHEGHDHNHDGHDHEAHDHSDHDHGPSAPKSLLDEDQEKQITSLLIRFKGRNFQALNMQRNINENTDLQAATPAIEISRLFSLMDTGQQALQILAMVIIFVSGLSIFISLFSSLRERKYELALMRSMGAKPVGIFTLIILEGLILASIGFLIGMLLSHSGMQLLANMIKDAYRYSFTGSQFLKEEGYLLIGALMIGVVAAIIPAIQASNTDISETLAKG
jgi:putative ABC transport system permease protein